MTVVIIISALLVIVAVLLLSAAKVVAEYRDNKLDCCVYLYKIRIYRLKGDGKFLKMLLSQPEKFPDLFKTVIRLLDKYVSLEKLDLRLRVGTSDAATTAIAVGALWATIYSLIGVIASIMEIKEHSVDIAPDYVNPTFSFNGKCILKSRVVYIIIIAVTILKIINPEKGKEE